MVPNFINCARCTGRDSDPHDLSITRRSIVRGYHYATRALSDRRDSNPEQRIFRIPASYRLRHDPILVDPPRFELGTKRL